MSPTCIFLPNGRHERRTSQPIKRESPTLFTSHRQLNVFTAKGAAKVDPFQVSTSNLDVELTIHEFGHCGCLVHLDCLKLRPASEAKSVYSVGEPGGKGHNHVRLRNGSISPLPSHLRSPQSGHPSFEAPAGRPSESFSRRKFRTRSDARLSTPRNPVRRCSISFTAMHASSVMKVTTAGFGSVPPTT